MKPWMKFLICISLSVMCLFVCVGYASVTDSLQIAGTVEVEIPYGLFITNIRELSNTNPGSASVSCVEFSTTVNSLISHKSNTASSVVYEITVLNNTEYEYAYRGLYYMSTYGNNSIVNSGTVDNKLGVTTNFPDGQLVRANGGTLKFTVTYAVGKKTATSLDTLLNFQFGINVDSVEKAYNIVYNKFLDILNTGTTYQQLVETLDDKFDGNQTWTSNYIGNVGNAVDNDMMTVETLFAGQLTMMVNGKAQKAWVIIKHEDIDDNELTGDDYTVTYNQYGPVTHAGCEMTLYMTIDNLSKKNSWAPVYATVFTCDRDASGNIISDWYRVGDSYYGQANIVGYRGENGGTGSFVTDNWISHASTYRITDDYSYNVGADIKIKDLMKVVDNSAIAEFQKLLADAENMIANQKYAGTGITVVEEAYSKAADFYTVGANGKAVANQDTRRVWLIPIMQDLDHVLTVAQNAIDAIEQGK